MTIKSKRILQPIIDLEQHGMPEAKRLHTQNGQPKHDSANGAPDALSKINLRLSIIGDRVRAVVRRESRGMYLHGRGGTGKTTKVLATLEKLKVKHEYFAGKITPGGLREFLANCVERDIAVIVFDDVAALLDNKDAVQLLLAVLDGKPIRYQRQGKPPEFIKYNGGIIFISNEAVPEWAVVGCVQDASSLSGISAHR